MTREEAINKLEYLINSPVGREEIDETCYVRTESEVGMDKWLKPVGQAKLICKIFGIQCEFATSWGYCQFTACVKVRPEVKRNG